jgi:hypothetical protein
MVSKIREAVIKVVNTRLLSAQRLRETSDQPLEVRF